jgi:hypothetical protein
MNRPLLLIVCAMFCICFIVLAAGISLKVIFTLLLFSGFLAISLKLFNHLTHHKYDDVTDEA